MLAYEYLKAQPKERYDLIVNDWNTLFNDPDLSYGARQQLIEMQMAGIPISDASLFFYGHITMMKLLNLSHSSSDNRTLERLTKMCKHKHWLDQSYTYCQTHPGADVIGGIFRMWDNLAASQEFLNWKLPYAIIERLFDSARNFSNGSIAPYLLYAINPLHDVNRVGRSAAELLLRGMSLKFLERAVYEQLEHCADLLKDCEQTDKRFNSIKEVERAHDARTDAEVKKLLKEKPANIIYSDVFKGLIEKYGFKLPATKNDMIERGARHHNCVATYADRHIQFTGGARESYCRLIFMPHATIELTVHIRHDLIVCVNVAQCKGAYNKEVEQPSELTHLRIALTGQPVDILYTGETYE